MKKIITVLLAACMLIPCIAAYGAQNEERIAVKINSDISGLTEQDESLLIEIKSGGIVYAKRSGSAVSATDYANSIYNGEFKPGRKYYISYTLEPAEGTELPDRITADEIDIECSDNVEVYHVAIVSADIRKDDDTYTHYKALMIQAAVTVDSNFPQRLAGMIYDFFIKLRAWQLY